MNFVAHARSVVANPGDSDHTHTLVNLTVLAVFWAFPVVHGTASYLACEFSTISSINNNTTINKFKYVASTVRECK